MIVLYPQLSRDQTFQVVVSAWSKSIVRDVRDVHKSPPRYTALIDYWPHAIAVGADALGVFRVDACSSRH